MKIFIIIVLSTLLNINSCNAQQKKDRLINKNDTVMSQEYGQIEKYDFTATENGTKDVIVEKNGWVIKKVRFSGGMAWYEEYAPAKYFYDIVKNFYSNGMIRSRCKGLGSLAFGIREEFDEQGNLIKLVDEDKKFGKIKPIDIVELFEKEGWFNRETGENKVARDSILPTNGYFYEKIIGFMRISFVSREYSKTGNCFWEIRIEPRFNMHPTYYVIDGETGQFTKKEAYEPKYD